MNIWHKKWFLFGIEINKQKNYSKINEFLTENCKRFRIRLSMQKFNKRRQRTELQ